MTDFSPAVPPPNVQGAIPVLDFGNWNNNTQSSQPNQQPQQPPPQPNQPSPLKSLLSALVQGAPLSSATQYLPGGSAEGATPVSVNGGVYPMFAKGGRPPVGRPVIVGEKGPELFVPDRPGRIYPNRSTERRASAKTSKLKMSAETRRQIRGAMRLGLISSKAARELGLIA